MFSVFAATMLLSVPFSEANAQKPYPASDETLRQEQEIRKVIDDFARAFAQVDTVSLNSLIADDYVHTNLDGGVLNKSQWLERAKARLAEIRSGKFRFDHYSYDDLRIRIYGNTAVVTGQATTVGQREGKVFKSNLRFTNVWVKREGRWQRVAFHDSAAAGE